MPQAAITGDNEYAVSGGRNHGFVDGVRRVRTPSRHARAVMGILRRASGRNRADAKNLSRMVGIECASGVRTGCGDDQLPRCGFRQITDSTEQVSATQGN